MSEHQVNQSGTCVIEDCPCRGWSAQETAGVKEVAEYDPRKAVHRIKLKHEKVVEAAKLLLAMNNCNYDRDQMRRSGGFDALWEAVKAIEPNWTKESSGEHQPAARGGGDAAGLVPATVLALAKKNQQIYDTDLSNALVKAVEVAHAEHQSLVAEREQMVEALKGVAIMLNTELEKYDKEPWAQRVRAVLGDQNGMREG